MSAFAAVDLGASSGRVIVSDESLRLSEVHRFANRPVRVSGTLYWDILGLYREIEYGLGLAGPVRSVGIDSWAVDYGLLDSAGKLLGNPVHYRDGRTRAAEPSDELYAASGIQFLAFNTVYQLLADRLDRAETMLLIPDLIAYWLTGEIGAEVTNASTTSLLDVHDRTWARGLIDRLGLPSRIFPPLRRPGDPIGAVPIGDRSAELVTVASHDTASAVVAVPATSERFAYISCGTWSLVGVELTAPVLTSRSFTNEAGIDGTIRYLRNVMGLWLLQECLRAWGEPELEPLLAAAAGSRPFAAVVDADASVFLPPGDMPARIAAECRRTGQDPPADLPAFVRCVMESLALAHRATLRQAIRLTGREVEVIHLVGGGARNALLCQLTADACGLPVVAGPAEATAVGNILVQARPAGVVTSLAEMRALVAGTQRLTRYEPKGDEARWDEVAAVLR
ncbi:rhamnulokinase [Sphaerisporangium album]|uniref:Rhamnulokinase n=1 Tax=Sphaerisporangium album TaxID=509200 RepID=A0A367F4Z9_9ACTN|nr:rhamnulokinase family protein [Sphaerisporangium album]RCG25423.1 rhamnulokinase [Sphaerisporangium album]